MKVCNLFEVDQWTNNPQTLKYLWNKQCSACHRFIIVATEVGFYSRQVTHGVQNTLARLESTFSMFSTMRKDLAKEYSSKEKIAEVLKAFDYMIKAKENYERAGGKYEGK